MSRIGKLPVVLPAKVEAKITGNTIQVKGEKGSLDFAFSDKVEVTMEDNSVVVSPN